MRGFLLVNPRSGSGNPDAGELVAAARERGLETHVLAEDDDPEELARGVDAEALGIAGGDGSLATVAAVAIERSLPFVCVPFGTRNHFARDLGLDRDDPIAALDSFTGSERRIDVGRVGDTLFLNNVSLGLYAGLVHRRERHRRRRDGFARLRALAVSLRHRHRLRFEIEGEIVAARVVLVANNAYSLDVFDVGERERLDEGRIHLYVPEGLFPGRWHDRATVDLTIDVAGHRVQAAIDGEPVELETPLDFRIEPGALRVLVPGAPE
jgi:diacylglycerol kinase family enzyme